MLYELDNDIATFTQIKFQKKLKTAGIIPEEDEQLTSERSDTRF